MAELRLESVVKRFGPVEVIKNVDLHIARGEFCVFVGPSGCGKSTLLRMISGLEDITEGVISIDGEVVNNVPAANRGLAMVFQSYALYPHMSVRQNLSFGLENLRAPRQEIEERVGHAAEMLRIHELLERKPKELSGGQRQRVAIGRAVVREPKIFLFDEPLSNLDAELRVTMRGEIASLHRRLGNTMIYVTHDQVEALTMADKIVVLRDGNVEQVGRPLDLYNKPQNRFVAGFIGSPRMNFLEARIATAGADGATVVDVAGGHSVTVDVPANGHGAGADLTLGVRPEHMSITDTGTGDLVASVDAIEQLGSESYLYCTLDGGEPLTVHLSGQTGVQRGDAIGLATDPALCHLFDRNSGAALGRSA